MQGDVIVFTSVLLPFKICRRVLLVRRLEGGIGLETHPAYCLSNSFDEYH